MKKSLVGLLAATAIVTATLNADACTRFVYQTATDGFIVGRSMDWMEDPGTDLYSFPRGLARNGGVGDGSIDWTAKYGSVIASLYGVATVEGMNDAGLVANTLYLAESDYGDAKASGKPLISVGAWTQYVLDNYATVAEAVEALSQEPFAIVAPTLPNGSKATGHLSLADASGDSAIFEYIGGRLVIHHGKQYTVMTNSPSFDQQLAIDTYWKGINGMSFLPGTITSPDRFVRMTWALNAVPKQKEERMAIATAFSLIRAVSVPLGLADPRQAEHRRHHLALDFRHWRQALLLRIILQPDDFLGRYRQAQSGGGISARQARSQGQADPCRRSLGEVCTGRAVQVFGAVIIH